MGRQSAFPVSREQATAWARENVGLIALVGLMALAAALRFWDLGARALHHDESLHAQYAWYVYQGRGYTHDPLMHGPFQFLGVGTVFFFLGASDYTARVMAAIFGTALVGMPWFLRKQIGMKAVLIAAVLLTFSPTLLYFGRFARSDIYTVGWTFALVICIWRYIDERRLLWLCGVAFFLVMSFATKETTFITAVIIIAFTDLMLAVELARGWRKPDEEWHLTAGRFLLLAPVAWLIAIAWPLLGAKPFGQERLPAVADVLIVVGTLSAPQFGAAIQSFGGLTGIDFLRDKGYHVKSEDSLRISTTAALLLGSLYIGMFWRPRDWLIIAAFFYVPYVLLFTTFFTNLPGFWTGIWGSLDYWLDQQDVKRGNQPGYYYALMTPLYEFLPLLLVLGGMVWLMLRRNAFRIWLLFWAIAMFAALTLAGEKMPWLESHIALPLALLGAIVLAAALDGLEVRGSRWWVVGVTAAVTAGAVLLVVGRSVPGGLQLLGWVLLGGVGAWVVASLAFEGYRAAGQVALSLVVGALFALTARSALMASFEHGDRPVEMLVYTQTSPDIPDLRDRIDRLARDSGLGYSLPIVVDPQDGFSWPWAWYLRDYKQVSHALGSATNPDANAVLLVANANVASVDPTGYTQVPYKHRWWFQETYRDLSVGDVVSELTHVDKLKSLWSFFLHRRPETKTGSVDAVAFFPDTLTGFETEKPETKPAPPPVTLPDGRIVIGRVGLNAGEFAQPADVFVDSAGSIWVADSRNNRVQKFDAAGNYQSMVLRSATGQARFNEPWSVAVDAEGNVYVADTWSHRIVKLSPSLEGITAWGRPTPGGASPGPFDLYGPRDIGVAPDGTLWVADTGNKRLVHYSSGGQDLGSFGSDGSAPGQFSEPVGLAFDSAGNLYVADTWNGRIQKFGPDMTFLREIQVGWSSREVTAKPYIAVLKDGRIIAGEPAKGELRLYDADGRLLGTWKPEADSLPLGISALADGGFVFADGRRNEVQIVPAKIVSSLFR